MKTLLALSAVAGLALGIRHFLNWRAARAAAPRRPIIGALAKKVRDAAGLPENVDVSSRSGVVTLRGGPVAKAEVDRTLAAVLAVPGVRQVRNYVQVS